MKEGTTFFACRKCYNNGCDTAPDNDTTEFRRSYTATSSGSAIVKIDEDGDAIEGDPDGWSDDDNVEPSEYIECACCDHSIYTTKASSGYRSLKDDTDIVALWQEYESERTYTLEFANTQGWLDDDEEDDRSAPDLTVRDDGRSIDVPIIVTAAPSDTQEEVQIIYGQ